MSETPSSVYNVGIPRPQPKPSFESQIQALPPDVRSVAESLALRDARIGTALPTNSKDTTGTHCFGLMQLGETTCGRTLAGTQL